VTKATESDHTHRLRNRCDGTGSRDTNCVFSDSFRWQPSCGNEPVRTVHGRAKYGRSERYSGQPDEAAIDVRKVPKRSGTTEYMQSQKKAGSVYSRAGCQQPIIGRSVTYQYQQTDGDESEQWRSETYSLEEPCHPARSLR
jgi:hypothetical protein